MGTLGKTAALATSARFATRQQERSRQLAGRIDLAREIHERVMQRLFGVSLVLGSEHELTGRSAPAAPTRSGARWATCARRWPPARPARARDRHDAA